jgi:hypothetical protein
MKVVLTELRRPGKRPSTPILGAFEEQKPK